VKSNLLVRARRDFFLPRVTFEQSLRVFCVMNFVKFLIECLEVNLIVVEFIMLVVAETESEFLCYSRWVLLSRNGQLKRKRR
jgi:hypothetical protein